MPITHVTIPVPPAKVGETEWAEAHTLPTPGEIGAITTASAATLLDPYLTSASAEAIYLTSASASTVYARQVSAVTTAQLAPYLTSASAEALYLTSASASTVYARQASAVTTAQLSPYITSDSVSTIYLLKQDASTTYARQASAVTTAQLSIYLTSSSAASIYLLSQDASTTYARQASAVTTAQLSIYLTSSSAAAVYVTSASADVTYARIASAVTTAQLGSYLTSASASAGYASIGAIVSVVNITEASADFKYGVTKYVTADVTNATTVATTLNDLIITVSGSTVYGIEGSLIWRSSLSTTGIGVLCSTTPTPGMFSFGVQIYGHGADGTAGIFAGYASVNGDIVIATSANVAPMNYPIAFTGTIITPGSTSKIQLAVASEVSNSGIVIRRGSWITARRLGAA